MPFLPGGKRLPVISNPNYPITPSTIPQNSQGNPTQVSITSLPNIAPNQGTLALGVTDPPSHGHYMNVTSLKVTITGVSLHSDSNSSWITVPLNQTIVDLVAATNLEQLVSTIQILSGHYNIVRFTISSAIAVIGNSSISLKIPSGQIQLTITNGGITLSNNGIAHLIIDVRINEAPILNAGVFAATSWTAKPAGN